MMTTDKHLMFAALPLAMLGWDVRKDSHHHHYAPLYMGKSRLCHDIPMYSFDIESSDIHGTEVCYVTEGSRHSTRPFPMVGLGHFLHRCEAASVLYSGAVGNIGIRQLRERRLGQNGLDSFGRFYQMEATDFQALLGNAPKVAVFMALTGTGLNVGLPIGLTQDWHLRLFLDPSLDKPRWVSYYHNGGEEENKKNKKDNNDNKVQWTGKKRR
jgi:hypothetical protein